MWVLQALGWATWITSSGSVASITSWSDGDFLAESYTWPTIGLPAISRSTLRARRVEPRRAGIMAMAEKESDMERHETRLRGVEIFAPKRAAHYVLFLNCCSLCDFSSTLLTSFSFNCFSLASTAVLLRPMI